MTTTLDFTEDDLDLIAAALGNYVAECVSPWHVDHAQDLADRINRRGFQQVVDRLTQVMDERGARTIGDLVEGGVA